MLGKFERTRRCDRQRRRWFDSLRDINWMALYELKEKAMDRIEWRMFVQRIASDLMVPSNNTAYFHGQLATVIIGSIIRDVL